MGRDAIKGPGGCQRNRRKPKETAGNEQQSRASRYDLPRPLATVTRWSKLLNISDRSRTAANSRLVRPPQFRPPLTNSPHVIVPGPLTLERVPTVLSGKLDQGQTHGHGARRIHGLPTDQVALRLARGLKPANPSDHVLFFQTRFHRQNRTASIGRDVITQLSRERKTISGTENRLNGGETCNRIPP